MAFRQKIYSVLRQIVMMMLSVTRLVERAVDVRELLVFHLEVKERNRKVSHLMMFSVSDLLHLLRPKYQVYQICYLVYVNKLLVLILKLLLELVIFYQEQVQELHYQVLLYQLPHLNMKAF